MTCDFGHRLLAVVLISGLGMLASGQPAARAQDSTSEPASDYSFTLSPYTGATHKLVSAPIGARLADFKPASPRGDVTESHRVARADAALAEEATNPLANLLQFQIQNSFVPSSFDSSGFSHALEIQPVIPYKLFDHLNILRLTVPVVLTPDFDGPVNETSGLGDTSFLNVTIFPNEWGNVAFGFNTVFPTATDERLGSGKWQAGPAAAFLVTKIPKWQLGALFFNNWSYATNRSGSENVNKMSVQWFATLGLRAQITF